MLFSLQRQAAEKNGVLTFKWDTNPDSNTHANRHTYIHYTHLEIHTCASAYTVGPSCNSNLFCSGKNVD
jgi:hypothetical protein